MRNGCDGELDEVGLRKQGSTEDANDCPKVEERSVKADAKKGDAVRNQAIESGWMSSKERGESKKRFAMSKVSDGIDETVT